MGSCISTCRPKKPPQDQDQDLYDPEVETLVHVQVQDKLVINIPTQDQAPKPTNTTPISPPSPSSSLSSFSCNTTSTNASCSSSLSSTSSSSSLTSKERAFSNEFLRTCIKDNPHLVKERGRPNSHVVQVMAPAKQSMTQQRATPQKRVRSSSPNNLTRQKSFRKDPSPPDLSSYYAPSRAGLRSPSPSRRFNSSVNKVSPNPTKALSLARNKENLRPPSPGRVVGYKSGLRNREALSLSKNIKNIDGSRFGEVKGIVGDDDQDIPMEDIDNPLISLDCFIFL